jgi:prolyl-tRNA synthetase
VKDDEKIIAECNRVHKELIEKGIRSHIDSYTNETIGFRINKWEIKGVPLRIDIGLRELEGDKLTGKRRDNGEKIELRKNDIFADISKTLSNIQDSLYQKSKTFLRENITEVRSYDEFKEVLETKRGLISCLWCEDANCESKIKEETKATTRCRPVDGKEENGTCIYCNKAAKYRWLFGQAY